MYTVLKLDVYGPRHEDSQLLGALRIAPYTFRRGPYTFRNGTFTFRKRPYSSNHLKDRVFYAKTVYFKAIYFHSEVYLLKVYGPLVKVIKNNRNLENIFVNFIKAHCSIETVEPK